MDRHTLQMLKREGKLLFLLLLNRYCLAVKVALIEESEVFDSLVIRVKDAYPFYDLDFKRKLLKIVNFLEKKNVVHCLGRTSIFRYNNSDGSIEMGIQLAKKLIADESDATALDYEVREISY